MEIKTLQILMHYNGQIQSSMLWGPITRLGPIKLFISHATHWCTESYGLMSLKGTCSYHDKSNSHITLTKLLARLVQLYRIDLQSILHITTVLCQDTLRGIPKLEIQATNQQIELERQNQLILSSNKVPTHSNVCTPIESVQTLYEAKESCWLIRAGQSF